METLISGKQRLLINLLNQDFPNCHILSTYFRIYEPFSIILKQLLWYSGKVYRDSQVSLRLDLSFKNRSHNFVLRNYFFVKFFSLNLECG